MHNGLKLHFFTNHLRPYASVFFGGHFIAAVAPWQDQFNDWDRDTTERRRMAAVHCPPCFLEKEKSIR